MTAFSSRIVWAIGLHPEQYLILAKLQSFDLLQLLETKEGRVIFNAYPTGVEVCHAMVHGGLYPARSDGRSTSVSTQAIYRFTRPVAYQGLPRLGSI